MPTTPPRPLPFQELIWLLRRPKSGFVNFPMFFNYRMVEGRARFMTRCDMLIGPCACGYTHTERSRWVRELLSNFNCKVEPLILWSTTLQDRGEVIEIPDYWRQNRRWESPSGRCDVLVGKCLCGRIHSPTDRWTKSTLQNHGAVILNMPEPTPVKAKPKAEKIELYEHTPFVDESSECVPSSPREQHYPTNLGHQDALAFVDESSECVPSSLRERHIPTNLGHQDGTLELPEARVPSGGSVAGCDCLICEQRPSIAELVEDAQVRWMQDAIDAWDSNDLLVSLIWASENCNEGGAIPSWCNCVPCRGRRLRTRDHPSPCSVSLGDCTVTPTPRDTEDAAVIAFADSVRSVGEMRIRRERANDE